MIYKGIEVFSSKNKKHKNLYLYNGIKKIKLLQNSHMSKMNKKNLQTSLFCMYIESEASAGEEKKC